MMCPGCHRDNDPKRRYCGKCGHNFQPVCRRCNFSNEHDDRFCGGCGANLIAREGCHVKRGALSPVPDVGPVEAPQVVAVEPVRASTPGDELAGLFSAPAVSVEPPRLPEVNIGQADLDRLFGASP